MNIAIVRLTLLLILGESLTVCRVVQGFHNINAAVIVPGFLTGADEFQPLCEKLTDMGIPTVAVPMPNWHWLPCLGGRSMRPILERVDFTVKHLIANDGDITKIPKYDYSFLDVWMDFMKNPGGVLEVGGSAKVDEYPLYDPAGKFPVPKAEAMAVGNKIALIGHSAGGFISRAYLSNREYGGRAYNGSQFVHSLVTLGTPHVEAIGPAFETVSWVNEEIVPVRALSVAGNGYRGNEWGSLTQGSYGFCCPEGTDGSHYDGDGVTPVFSALGMEGSEEMVLNGVGHFCWSDVFGGSFVAPELTQGHKDGRPWYGSDDVADKWAKWIIEGVTDHSSS